MPCRGEDRPCRGGQAASDPGRTWERVGVGSLSQGWDGVGSAVPQLLSGGVFLGILPILTCPCSAWVCFGGAGRGLCQGKAVTLQERFPMDAPQPGQRRSSASCAGGLGTH